MALLRLETCLRGVDSGDGGTDGVCYPGTNVGIQRLVRDGEMEEGVEGWKEIIHLSLNPHHQNDSCTKTGSDESHFNVS